MAIDYSSLAQNLGGSSTPFAPAQPVLATPTPSNNGATPPTPTAPSGGVDYGAMASALGGGSQPQTELATSANPPTQNNTGEQIKAGLRSDISKGGLGGFMSGLIGTVGDIGQGLSSGLAGAAGNVASLATRAGAGLESLLGAHDQEKTLNDTADSINQWVQNLKQRAEGETNVVLPKWTTNLISGGIPFVAGGELLKLGDVAGAAGKVVSGLFPETSPIVGGLVGGAAKKAVTTAGMSAIGGATAPEGQGVQGAEGAAIGTGIFEGGAGLLKLASGLSSSTADSLIKSQIFAGGKTDQATLSSLAGKIGSNQPDWKSFVNNWKSLLPDIGGMPPPGYQGLKTGLDNINAGISKYGSRIQSGLDNGINNGSIFNPKGTVTVGDVFPNFEQDMAGIKGNGDPVTTNRGVAVAQRTFLNTLFKLGKLPDSAIFNASDEESGPLVKSYNDMFDSAKNIKLTPSDLNTIRQDLGGYAYSGTPTQLQTVKSQVLQKMWQGVKQAFSKSTNNAFDTEIQNQQTLMLSRNGIQSNLDTINNGEAGLHLGNLFRPHTAISAASDALMNYPQYRFGAATALDGLSKFFSGLSKITDPSEIGAKVNNFSTNNPEFAPAIKNIVSQGGKPADWAKSVGEVESNLLKEPAPTPPNPPPTETPPPTFNQGETSLPTTAEGLNAAGKTQKPAFDQTLQSVAQDTGSAAKTTDVKSVQSIKDKQATQDLGKSEAGAATSANASLVEQAKKYKSADEFVKAQGEVLYRGQPRGVETKDVSYWSSDKSYAKAYSGGGEIKEAIFKPNNPLVFNEPKWMSEMERPSKNISLIEEAKKNGNDSIIYNKTNGEKTIIILDKSLIKTESQLQDIWKQAQVGKSEAGAATSAYKSVGAARAGFSTAQDVMRDRQLPVGIGNFTKDEVARERFDIPNLKKVGAGSDRDVYDLGNGQVVKIAKTARGLAQNQMADPYAADAGLIPNVHEIGRNYVVMDKALPPDANVKKMVKELQGLTLNKGIQGAVPYYRDIDKLQQILEKYGYNSSDLMNYGDNQLWGDFQRLTSWGVSKDGKPLLLDEGSLNGDFVKNFTGVKNLQDPDFREVYNASKAARIKYGDLDKKTMYGLMPLGVIGAGAATSATPVNKKSQAASDELTSK